MADIKLSGLAAKGAASDLADLFETTTGGLTRSVTGRNLLDMVGADNLAAIVDVAAARSNISALEDGANTVTEANLSAAVQTKLNNTAPSKFDATVPPAVTDDSPAYEVGSVWIDVVADEAYRCVAAPGTGNAIWINTTLTTSELGTMVVQNSNSVTITGGSITGLSALSTDTVTAETLSVSNAGTATLNVWGDTNNDVGEAGALLDIRTDGGAVRAQVGIPQGTSNALEIKSGGDLTSASSVNSPIVFYTKGASEAPKEVARFSGGSGAATFNYDVNVTGNLLVNNIAELTPAAGVTIDGITHKDSNVIVPGEVQDVNGDNLLTSNGVTLVLGDVSTGATVGAFAANINVVRPSTVGLCELGTNGFYWWRVTSDVIRAASITERVVGAGVNIEDVKIRDDTLEVNIGGSAKTLISKGQVTLDGVSGVQPQITWVNTSGVNQWRLSASPGSFELTEVGVSAVWRVWPGGVTEFYGEVQANTINESTASAGVTVDGVLLKDSGVAATNLFLGNITATTISAGSIAATDATIRLAPETGTADTVTAITGGVRGQILVLLVQSDADTITIQDNSNIRLNGDMVLDTRFDTLTLMYVDVLGAWLELSRSNNQ